MPTPLRSCSRTCSTKRQKKASAPLSTSACRAGRAKSCAARNAPYFSSIMNHDAYRDAYIRDILANNRTIAMVGASPNTSRPSYFAMKYLKAKGFHVIPVNPGQAGKEILGERVYAALADIKEPIDIVDIFRSSDAALLIAKEAIRIGAKVVWMQLGVRNDEVVKLAEEAGFKSVVDPRPQIRSGRVLGRAQWGGVESAKVAEQPPFMGGKGVQHRVLGRQGLPRLFLLSHPPSGY